MCALGFELGLAWEISLWQLQSKRFVANWTILNDSNLYNPDENFSVSFDNGESK